MGEGELLQLWSDVAFESTLGALILLENVEMDDNCTEQEVAAMPETLGGAYVGIDEEESSFVFALLAPLSVQLRLTEAMVGRDAVSVSGEQMRDTMGELSNMIVGIAREKMNAHRGGDATVGLPVFISGQYFGTSAAGAQVARRAIRIFGECCQVFMLTQRASGELVRRRRAERALRDSEERLRAILHGVPDAVITLTRENHIDSVNPAAEKMFDSPSADMVGRMSTCLFESDVKISSLDAFVPRTVTCVKQEGQKFPAEVTASPFFFQGVEQRALIVRDMTQQELAKRELKEANARMVELSHAAGKAEVASDVLHNVGNVLNNIKTT